MKDLGRHGRILTITSEVAAQLDLWRNTTDAEERRKRFSHWLYTAELGYDYVLLIADDQDTHWTAICTSLADKMLLLATPSSVTVGELERKYISSTNLHELIDVIVISDSLRGGKTSSSSRLLNHRQEDGLLHLQDASDARRIARYLSGNAVKLVLGGGGAKGFAHLGVYRAMCELGIPVDLVGGTSIGALMAATKAMGWDYEDMVSRAYQSFVIAKPLKDYHLPLVSLFSADKLEREIAKNLGEVDISDLQIPFYAIAANISKMSTHIIDYGLVKNAIRASISLPSVLAPFVDGNNLLLDGGIVDNMPYDHMQTLAEGPTFGVDLSYIKERELGYDRIPKSSQLLLAKFRRKKKYKVPGIHHIMVGTMTLASNEKRLLNMNKFEVYIQPDVAKYGYFRWEDFYPIIEEGYKASIGPLRQWLQANEGSL